MIFWFFGFPGTGKDYCAKRLSKLIKAKYLHIDDFLTKSDKDKLTLGTFTINDRLSKLKRVADHIQKITKEAKDVVAADSLPDLRSREFLFKKFKNNIIFVLVKVAPKIHRKRIKERSNHFFTEALLDNWINKHWVEPITVPYLVLNNDKEGDKDIKAELKKIIDSVKI